MMKLVVAIVQDQDSSILSEEFREARIPATKLSSSGSFLRAGNTTFLIGIEEERVEEVLRVIQDNCQGRKLMTTPPVHLDASVGTDISYQVPVQVGGATVFILPIEQHFRF